MKKEKSICQSGYIVLRTHRRKVYRESVESFNEKYNGKYFADIEFIPRNDSGGGYSDKINSSVLSGDLPDVLTLDGPNVAAYAKNNIIQPLAPLTEEERGNIWNLSLIKELMMRNSMLWE